MIFYASVLIVLSMLINGINGTTKASAFEYLENSIDTESGQGWSGEQVLVNPFVTE